MEKDLFDQKNEKVVGALDKYNIGEYQKVAF